MAATTGRDRTVSPVTVHAALAGLALVAAYMTWTRDKTQPQVESVIALDVNKRDIETIAYEDENRTVTVEKKSGEDGQPYTWVTVKQRSKTLVTNPIAPTPAPAAPGAPPAPGPMNPHAAPGPMNPHAAPGAPNPHGVAPAPMPPAPPAAPAAAPGKPAPAVKKGGEKAAGADKTQPNPPLPAGHPQPGTPIPAAPGGHPPVGPGAPPAPTAAPPPPAAPGSQPIHDVKETVTVKEFRGNDQADKLIELFAPLRMSRGLGMVNDQKNKDLGFDNSKKSLTVTAKGQTTKFVLGATTYGSGDSYAKDPAGKAYLLSQRIVSDLEFAESRLIERRLHRFERPDFDRLEVSVNATNKTRALVQKNRTDSVNFFFTDLSDPEKRDDSLKNWVDKLLRLAIEGYVAKGEEPKVDTAAASTSGAPAQGELFTVKFFDGKKELGRATFYRYQKNGQNEYYARTESTVGLVKLVAATAESAIQDAEKW